MGGSNTDTAGPRILFIDIETSPILGFAWQKYEVDIIEAYRDWSILCFVAHWKGGPWEIRSIDPPKSISAFIRDRDSDRAVVKTLWHLLDRADWVVAHNGDSFDIKKINARFLYYGLPPPSPYKSIDTKKAVKRVSANTSNKLDDLGNLWGVGRKIKHEGFELWTKCMDGDVAAWRRMLKYNKQDVVLLEAVYTRLVPWIKTLNRGMFTDGKTVCPHCGSHQLQSRGFEIMKTTKYRRVQCQECGGWSRVPTGEKITKPLVAL